MKENDNTYSNIGSEGEMKEEIWCHSLKNNAFKVPEGYFDELESVTCFRALHDDALKSGNAVNQQNGMRVPTSYFAKLETSILGKIAGQTTEVEVESEEFKRAIGIDASATSSTSANGFNVPEGYFSSLENRVMSAIAELGESGNDGVVRGLSKEPVVRKLFNPSWFRYAAAACILVASSLFIVKFNQSKSEFNLSDIPDQDLINYLQVYSGTQDVVALSTFASERSDSDIRSDISTEDLQWYLENIL